MPGKLTGMLSNVRESIEASIYKHVFKGGIQMIRGILDDVDEALDRKITQEDGNAEQGNGESRPTDHRDGDVPKESGNSRGKGRGDGGKGPTN